MGSSWIPTWADAGWTIAFVAVLGIHLQHTLALSGRLRLWHASHVLMALGMIDMFWPVRAMPVGSRTGEVVFALAALAALAYSGADLVGRRRPPWVAVIATVDLLGMLYMFDQSNVGNTLVTLVLTGWFVIEALGWASGVLSRVAASAGSRQGLPVDAPTVAEPVAVGARRSRGPASGVTARPGQQTDHDLHVHQVRLTLVVMSIGMSYMLLAMQFGTMAMASHAPGMAGM